MIYTTYDDMAGCIRRNIWKVPPDVELIVGVPRSGMIAALMIAELLNKRCVSLDDFVEGRVMQCGGRGRLIRNNKEGKVLVVDDTVFFGNAMRKARERLKVMDGRYDIVYGCVYAEGQRAKETVDIYFEENYRAGEAWYYYEWNILHHYGKRTQTMMWDIDGLICKDPPDERNCKAYEAYLPQAIPMIIPTTTIGALVTYRLEKYRSVTEAWLMAHGVEYGELMMFPSMDREERNHRLGSAQYKAQIYGNAPWAQLFYESSAKQAETIHRLTGKPVWCYENGKMWQ